MNSTTLLIGFAAFISAFLHCLQAINVTRDRFWPAAFVSFLIGVSQLLLLRQVPASVGWDDGIAFVLGGLLGSQFSMIYTRFRIKHEAKRNYHASVAARHLHPTHRHSR